MSYKYTHGTKLVRRSKYSVFIVILVIAGSGYQTAKYFDNQNHEPSHNPARIVVADTQVKAQKYNPNYSLPVRLQIPKLKVDSRVKYVGLTKDGKMNMPSTVYDVGWYKYGALPGNQGTAVIAGHLNGLSSEPGVFSNLTKLSKGDIITATESNGLTVNFAVRETRNYPENAQPEEAFTSTEGSHLNLITCTGDWDKTGRSFTQRLVVFADLVQ